MKKKDLDSALLTVIRITDARAPTDDTPGMVNQWLKLALIGAINAISITNTKNLQIQIINTIRWLKPALIRAVVALVTNPDKSAGPDVGVADHTLSVTLLTQPPWFQLISLQLSS